MLRLLAKPNIMKEAREKLGFRQADVASLAGSLTTTKLDRSIISRIENGQLSLDSHTALAISKVLESNAGDLFIPKESLEHDQTNQ